MSSKTTFKRIALVAVAALGLGVVTTVAPASATDGKVTAVSAGTPGVARVGVDSGRVAVTFTHPTGTTDSQTVAAVITSTTASTSSAAALKWSNPTAAKVSAAAANFTGGHDSSTTAGVSYATFDQLTAKTSTTLYLTLNADKAGSYTILISSGATSYTAGNASTSVTITTNDSAVSSFTMTPVISTSVEGSVGTIMAVTAKDAAGNATVPGLNEGIVLSGTGLGFAVLGGAHTTTLTTADFFTAAGANNTAYVRVTATTGSADAFVVTATGNGLIPSTTTAQKSLTFKVDAVSTNSDAALLLNDAVTKGYLLSSTTYSVDPSVTSHSLEITRATTTAASVDALTVTDTNGVITGYAGATVDYPASMAIATASVAVSISASLGTTKSFSVSGVGESFTFTGATNTTYTIGDLSPAAITSATGATNSFVAKVTNGYGYAVQGVVVVASVTSGRNSTVTAKNLITDANGYVSYSLTDAGTSGTSDTVNFELADGSGDKQATITYGTYTVSTVTLNGGNTTAGVTATVPVLKDIDAEDGAETGVQPFTATVKDANGVLLSGLPVVWTVSGTGAAITSTTKTSYTSAGVATAQVYAWLKGTYTVTATVGGKSGTGTISFAQTVNNSEQRAISATVEGNVVTALVVDRYGNPVPGVEVYATKSGTGSFGTGVSKTHTTADTNGQAEFSFTGSGDVTVSTIDYTTVGAVGSGQSNSRKGAIDYNVDAADDTEFTAYTAGTSTVDEEGVGASYAAAGVPSATITVNGTTASDSLDAANEATDAANAATDAANAAAEAADAATAAAQDAQAAVAALATSVASLIAGIKAQITTLTNLVVKIQKKVKA